MTQQITLSDGTLTLVSPEDYEALSVFRWHRRKDAYTSYVQRNVKGGSVVCMHRQILGLKSGEFGDHINGNGLDNRRENLRKVTKAQNCQNRINVRKDNKSGHTGVCQRSDGTWRAYGYWNKTTRMLGSFPTKAEALVVRREFENSERSV